MIMTCIHVYKFFGYRNVARSDQSSKLIDPENLSGKMWKDVESLVFQTPIFVAGSMLVPG